MIHSIGRGCLLWLLYIVQTCLVYCLVFGSPVICNTCCALPVFSVCPYYVYVMCRIVENKALQCCESVCQGWMQVSLQSYMFVMVKGRICAINVRPLIPFDTQVVPDERGHGNVSFGTVGTEESHSKTFKLANSNPVEVMIKKIAVSIKRTKIRLVSLRSLKSGAQRRIALSTQSVRAHFCMGRDTRGSLPEISIFPSLRSAFVLVYASVSIYLCHSKWPQDILFPSFFCLFRSVCVLCCCIHLLRFVIVSV